MAQVDWEKRIENWQKEGRGTGQGADWKTWIPSNEAPTRGRRHRPFSHKFGREMHLHCDGEYGVFMLAERATWVGHAREHVPIHRTLSQAVAKAIGIRHPCYPGSHVPCVLTWDLLAEGTQSGKHRQVVFDSKVVSGAEEQRTLEKLQIAKVCAQRQGYEYVLTLKEHLPETVIANLVWIRSGVPRRLEKSPYDGYWDDQCDALFSHFTDRACSRATLNAECNRFSELSGIPVNDALRAAKLLLHGRRMEMDLRLAKPQEQPMANFRLCHPRDEQHRGVA